MSSYSIDYIYLPRLRNSYHVAFHGAVSRELSTNDLTDVYGTDLDQRYSAALKAEQDIVNRSQSSQYTTELETYDKTRDNYYRRIYYRLKCAEYDSENTAITEDLVTKIKSSILNAYTLTVVNKANQEETAVIKGFIQDIRSILAESLTTLGIEDDLLKLETANDQYEINFMNRVHEYAASSDAKTYREATDDAYVQICHSLVYEANIVTTDTTEQAKVTLAQTVINDLNTLIKIYKSKMKSASNTEVPDDVTEETTETKTEA